MTFKEAVRASIKGDDNAFENVQVNNLRAYDLSQLCLAFAVWRVNPTLLNALNVCTKYHNVYKYHLPNFKRLSTVPGMDNWDRDPLHALHTHVCNTTHPGRTVSSALMEYFPLLGAVDNDDGVWLAAVDEWVAWAHEARQ